MLFEFARSTQGGSEDKDLWTFNTGRREWSLISDGASFASRPAMAAKYFLFSLFLGIHDGQLWIASLV